MPRPCSVCKHPDLNEINQALLKSDTLKSITVRFGPSKQALIRHRDTHIPKTLAKAKDAEKVVEAADLLQSIRSLHETTLKILRSAESEKRWETALKAIQQARANLELLAKLDGQLQEREPGNINITVNYVDKAIVAPGAPPRRLIAAEQPT